MTSSPFSPRFETLAETIPIFPLAGALLLPRGMLPLNIFEPRYLSMVDDTLKTDRTIGMVQPVEQAHQTSVVGVYPVGCAGRITSFDETDDGRYLITLTGVCRFRIADELPVHHGYRRVRADWSGFAGDFDEPPIRLDRDRLCAVLAGYFKRHGISVNWEAIRATPAERLVTSLSMICPFDPLEKQALLEAPTPDARANLMINLIEMAVMRHQDDTNGACH